MAKERNAFKAGLFIVISVLLMIGVIVGIRGVGQLIEPQQVRAASFGIGDDVSGLRVGDDVRVGGVKVGVVRSLQVRSPAARSEPPQEQQQPTVLVTFRLPERIVLRQGARVAVQSTVTGTSWLNFDNLGKGEPLAEDVVLQGDPGTMTRVLGALNDIAPQLSAIANDLRTVTIPKVNDAVDHTGALAADARGRIDGIVQRYNVVADRMAEVMVELRDLLGESKGDIRGSLANVNAATGTLREQLPPIMEKADSALAKLNESLDEAQGSLKDLTVALENVREVSGSARSIMVQNRSRIDGIVRGAKAASDNLQAATAEIRRSPWRLLYRPRPNEMANLNLFDAARAFADGANAMSDAATALRDALEDPNADPELIQKLVNQLDESFGSFQQVEEALWERVR